MPISARAWARGGVILCTAGAAMRPAAAQQCDRICGDRAAAIVVAYVAGETVMAAAHPSDWCQ
ncbi:MAG: hypothetical protein ABSB58_01105 [Gemmatimonadales bacterium]